MVKSGRVENAQTDDGKRERLGVCRGRVEGGQGKEWKQGFNNQFA